jgi:hypothetical protein
MLGERRTEGGLVGHLRRSEPFSERLKVKAGWRAIGATVALFTTPCSELGLEIGKK